MQFGDLKIYKKFLLMTCCINTTENLLIHWHCRAIYVLTGFHLDEKVIRDEIRYI